VVKKNPDAAFIAATAVAAVVLLHTAKVFVDAPPVPTNESKAAITTNATQSAQVPTQATQLKTEATAPIYTEPPIILYDVPLDAKLQFHIIQVAESYGIDPAIIFAMCYRESTYDPSRIGDYGEAFGLMQIQPKWHSDRMARLGCTGLLDPFQNVVVGIDYLAEQKARYSGDIYKALVAYNAGHYKGTITKYAMEIMAKAEELRGTTYEAEK
jgi:soluble lytic murein transglycosylase-like protein